MKRSLETKAIEDYIVKAACFSFVFGVFLGAILSVWAYCTLFWGRDSVNDISAFLCLGLMALCAWAIIKVTETEAKKNEQFRTSCEGGATRTEASNPSGNPLLP